MESRDSARAATTGMSTNSTAPKTPCPTRETKSQPGHGDSAEDRLNTVKPVNAVRSAGRNPTWSSQRPAVLFGRSERDGMTEVLPVRPGTPGSKPEVGNSIE